jgi:hypothetical protein
MELRAPIKLVQLHGLPFAPFGPPIRLVHELPRHRCELGVSALLLFIVCLVPRSTVQPLRLLVFELPLPVAELEQCELLSPPYPRRRAQLPQLRVLEVPSERVQLGHVQPLPQQLDGSRRR